MRINLSIRRQAFEGLLQGYPKKTLARELGISPSSLQAWDIYIQNDYYEWLDHLHGRKRQERIEQAVDYWIREYPIGYSDVARMFGLRPSSVYNAIDLRLSRTAPVFRPKRLAFWNNADNSKVGAFRMTINSLEDIPGDRPLTKAERKALFKEIQEAKERLLCSEALLEVLEEDCRDEIKKKELQRQLELVRKALASYERVAI